MADTGCAYLFHPDAIEAPGARLVGRRVAGTSFLRAFVQYAPGDSLQFVAPDMGARDVLTDWLAEARVDRPYAIDVLSSGHRFGDYGALFLPEPGVQDLPWLRQMHNPRGTSLIGITHSVSTLRVADALRDMLTSPIETWDAIVCTSRSARDVISTHLDLHGKYLSQRFQAARMPMPQLPVLPLGIHPDDFQATPHHRREFRDRYAVQGDDIVILTVGRHSSVEKANPVPLFQVAEQLAARHGQPIHLWCSGWAAHDDEQQLHERAARDICPSVTVRFIDGTDAEARHHIWSGADMFTMPIDSIQETFGLATIEAMAAGLPVVMPDWNGIRDTVVHGDTGFLIPTVMAAPGGGHVLADRFRTGTDSYLQHLCLTQQQVAIDQPAYLEALLTLAQSPDLRRKMGTNARERVLSTFSWRAVMPHYMDMSDELAKLRTRSPQITPRFSGRLANPQAVDPFVLFASYASHKLTPDTVLAVPTPPGIGDLEALDHLNGRALYGRWIASNDMVIEVATHVHAHGPVRYGDLGAALPYDPHLLEGVVLFLMKYAMMQVTGAMAKTP